MKVTRSQKIYFGALGVGLCAFVLDKAFASAAPTPGDLLAALTAPDLLPEKSGAAPLPADAATAVFDPALASRLGGLSELLGTGLPARDGFTPSPAWHVGSAESIEPGERGRRLKLAHRVKAIVQGRRGQVMLDSNLIAIGQSVDGFTLLSVSRMRAVFAADGECVELTLEGSASGISQSGSGIASITP